MSVTNEEKSAQLERILRSRLMHGSEILRALLRFIVQSAIDGQENLKEFVIATEVFGRGSDFNPRIDSVVRVQAGRLRSKLLEYYVTEGRDDPVIIELPKGHYAPVFSYSRHDGFPQGGKMTYTAGAEERVEPADVYQDIALLWGRMLQAPEPALVVFSNSIFHGTSETGMRLFNSLDEISHNPGLPAGENVISQSPRIDHYTGIGEAMGIYFFGDFFARIHHPHRVKRSLLLTWDDVRTENIVALGSPAENLFLSDLPRKQDFVFRWMRDERNHEVNAIVNTNPQPGEQECYLARQYGQSPSQISEDYAVISSLAGLSRKNRLMILAGINTFGTQAAAEYVTRPEYIRDLISHLDTASAGEEPKLPEDYQILIKVKVAGGVPIDISYVTHHVLNQVMDTAK
jgi:hypothetical protein